MLRWGFIVEDQGVYGVKAFKADFNYQGEVSIMGKDSTTELEVFAGICGFTTTIKIKPEPGYMATLSLESQCPNYKKVAAALGTEPLNVMDELFKKGQSKVLGACKGNIPHVSCPVPAAILKALEVGVGLALPRDPKITFKS